MSFQKTRLDESRELVRRAMDVAYGSYMEQEGKKYDSWRDLSIGQLADHLRHEVNEEIMGNVRRGEIGFLMHNAMDAVELAAMLMAKAQLMLGEKEGEDARR